MMEVKIRAEIDEIDNKCIMEKMWKWLSCVKLLQPCGILQARILEWVAFLFSRESFRPRDWSQVSRIAGRFFATWAIREARENTNIKIWKYKI